MARRHIDRFHSSLEADRGSLGPPLLGEHIVVAPSGPGIVVDGVKRCLGHADGRQAEKHSQMRGQTEPALMHHPMPVEEDDVGLHIQPHQRLECEPPLAEGQVSGGIGTVRLALGRAGRHQPEAAVKDDGGRPSVQTVLGVGDIDAGREARAAWTLGGERAQHHLFGQPRLDRGGLLPGHTPGMRQGDSHSRHPYLLDLFLRLYFNLSQTKRRPQTLRRRRFRRCGMSAPAVLVDHLSKSFGEVRAVEDVSFDVRRGEVFGLLGPNGAGKTTAIRMILDIFKPDSGRVEILGSAPERVCKDRIGYLPEERGLYKDISLEQVLVFFARLKGLSDGEAKSRLSPWLERMDLYDHRRKKVQELSKGMQQKAQVIATLLHEPDLIVVDEPFAGLDPVNTRLIKEVLLEQVNAGKAVIMSTHQMHQAEALCQRIVLIDHGRTVLYGSVEDIKRDFAANAIVLEGEGDFSDLPHVLEARREDGGWRLSLAAGADPQEVLKALAARPGFRLHRFERAEPSLDDIFINVVTGGGAAVRRPGGPEVA